MTIPARYTRIAAILHWLIALLIVANVVLGVWANHVPDDWVRPMIDTHKSIGITVLGLAIMRLLWRFSHPAPKLPETYARGERLAAHGVHFLLYVWIFALPITGWLHDSAWKDAATHPLALFGVVPWFRIGFIEGLDPAVKETAAYAARQRAFLVRLPAVRLVRPACRRRPEAPVDRPASPSSSASTRSE